jgi:SAM-dependent methyltransferase
MGLGLGFLRSLIALKTSGALDGAKRVIEIGAQQLANNLLEAAELDEVYRLFGRPRVDLGAPVAVDQFARSAPSSRRFWTSLGWDYTAVDYVGDAIRIDLNRNRAPWRLRRSFDLVVNTGTTEHVANQENAFRVIHDLTKPNGVMLHEVPCQGLMTHGLVHYTPKFFWYLCRENMYEVLSLQVSADGPCDIPQDVLDSNQKYGQGIVVAPENRMLQGFSIRAALRKREGRGRYRTPLDVPSEFLR